MRVGGDGQRTDSKKHAPCSEAALAIAPAGKPRAMILVQLAEVAAKQGRADDTLELVAQARALLPAPGPAVLDAIAADALMRVWRWDKKRSCRRALRRRRPRATATRGCCSRAVSARSPTIPGAFAAAATAWSYRRAIRICCAPKRPRSPACIAAKQMLRLPPTNGSVASLDFLGGAAHRMRWSFERVRSRTPGTRDIRHEMRAARREECVLTRRVLYGRGWKMDQLINRRQATGDRAEPRWRGEALYVGLAPHAGLGAMLRLVPADAAHASGNMLQRRYGL